MIYAVGLGAYIITIPKRRPKNVLILKKITNHTQLGILSTKTHFLYIKKSQSQRRAVGTGNLRLIMGERFGQNSASGGGHFSGMYNNNRVTAVLTLIHGPKYGGFPLRIELSGNAVAIGRALTNDVTFDFVRMSRRHAVFEYKCNKWFLTHLSSKQDSKINNVRLEVGIPAELFHNDVVGFCCLSKSPDAPKHAEYRFEYTNSFTDLPCDLVKMMSKL